MKVSIRRPDDVPEGTPMAVSLRSTAELRTGNWRTFRPEYVTRPSPCNLDCPAGTDVRTFLAQAAAGDAVGAWRTILERNPFPGICGRVCYHPCEIGCNRAPHDEAIAVHVVERAIASEAARQGALREVRTNATPSGFTVAVIGAGPAGLSCAYQLGRRGHAVTVFEGEAEPGGMLRYGIPEYRLPRHVLTQELDVLRQFPIAIQTGMRLGKELEWSALESFDAVYVAVGIQRSKSMRIAGEHLPGVAPALDFLRLVNREEATPVSGRVVVIGGGNTAMDAARVALRQGAEVTVVYRRSREEMPAHPDEVAQAEREGVRFEFQVSPVRFLSRRGALNGLRCERTRLGEPDASGRRRPEPLPGSAFSIPCDHAFSAIGEELETEAFESVIEMSRGHLSADTWGRTAARAVFAGGDAATGAGTVVEAIGSGARSAEAIDAWLGGRDVPLDASRGDRVVKEDMNLYYFTPAARVRVPMLDRSSATSSFREVTGGLFWKEAVAEAGRCLTCGSCNECGNCLVFCPDAAVHKAQGSGFTIDYLHCKGCGICVTECPRGAMSLIPEETR